MNILAKWRARQARPGKMAGAANAKVDIASQFGLILVKFYSLSHVSGTNTTPLKGKYVILL